MMNDWKAALAGLKDSGELPEGEEREQAAEIEEKPRQEGALHIVFERKGRGGKSATIIEGFTLPDEQVAEIATKLRRSLGTGGSSRGGEILLQGECRQKAAELLRSYGFKVKG